jgi:hypothetical protein
VAPEEAEEQGGQGEQGEEAQEQGEQGEEQGVEVLGEQATQNQPQAAQQVPTVVNAGLASAPQDDGNGFPVVPVVLAGLGLVLGALSLVTWRRTRRPSAG